MHPTQAIFNGDLGIPDRFVDRMVWWFTGVGIGLRLSTYLLRFPIWTDEAKLTTSLLDRSYAELMQPLDYGQIAPFLFMWIQKAVSTLLGFTEYSLRLFPLLAAVAGMLLMRHVARRLFGGWPALFAVAILAVSYYPVRHGAEMKPYATDLLASLVLTALAVEWLHRPERARGLWLLAAAAPVVVAVSYPAIFVAAGVVAALALPAWRRGGWSSRLALAVAGLLAGGTFLLGYVPSIRRLDLHASDMMEFWSDSFPPWNDPIGLVIWFLRTHTGRTFGYPIGSDDGGSILTFAVFVVGIVVLLRAGRRALLALLLLPFFAAFVAAVLQRYPYGGSGRVSQYMVPAICLLAGLGIAHLVSRARNAARRRRAAVGVLGFLAFCGLLLTVVSIVRPYRDRPDLLSRDFARWFWHVKASDAELVGAWEDLRLEIARPRIVWTPGAAEYRVNQRIYHDRARRGEPPCLECVSRERPLRVVFLASSIRRAGLGAWLLDMQREHDLVGRERHDPGGFAEENSLGGDWIEVYTFSPSSPRPTEDVP
jgi:4-amino-4-deoxy-L-arabinose transferase-like glycosyltransferase